MAYNTPSNMMQKPHVADPTQFNIPSIRCADNPGGDYRDSEVRGMNRDHQEEQRYWKREHQ